MRPLTIGTPFPYTTLFRSHITYGDSDPAFTFTYDGFVNAQDATVLGTEPTCSVAGAHANAGAYDITCAGGVDNNYDRNSDEYGNTVGKAARKVTANDQHITYGDSNHAFTST